jgi:hypothetical protein
MEQGTQPNGLRRDQFREFAMLLRLVRVEVSEVSILILSDFYLLLHGCNDGMRSQRYPMCDCHRDYEEQHDQWR